MSTPELRAVLLTGARRWVLGGRVQGVGFRPFVYRMAHRHGVRGWVRNLTGQVEVVAQGSAEELTRFGAALIAEAPPLAKPEVLSEEPVAPQPVQNFTIGESRRDDSARITVPPDYFACDDCLAELRDPHNRRYRYPFINCTQCGPRYTLIRALPYDRSRTTMGAFLMCPRCSAEYNDPMDRRFHAEPIACPECGPSLAFRCGRSTATGDAALEACADAVRSGKLVAVKGVGGYHIVCDASSESAVARLRERKGRPDKPLAVMFPIDEHLRSVRRAVKLDAQAEAQLRDPMRPIVLLPRRARCTLARGIAPGVAELGAMLPYSPLHHLLLDALGMPVVATSGNVSGEPVLTDNAEAHQRLAPVVDAFLHHDRPIARPADDPVFRLIAGKPRPIRLGRGCAPLEIELPFELKHPTLALGGHLKDTVALGWKRQCIVSPHLGDMEAPRSLALLAQVASDLQKLYGVKAEQLACDAHPHYASTRLAMRLGLPVKRVWHHRAHASALAGETDARAERLVFAWDGSGFGEDGTLWGGEALLGVPGHWRRVASFRPFSLLGGDRAAREPWRSGLALCWEAGVKPPWENETVALLRHAWERSVNCPRTSSAGRLFDAAAALAGLITHASFEGQAPMQLEALCTGSGEAVALPLAERADGLLVTDWQPLIEPLRDAGTELAARAALFHASLARAVLDQARAVRERFGVKRLGLSGGVFQNRVLCEAVARLARAQGFELALPQKLPANDAALSFGQLVEVSVS